MWETRVHTGLGESRFKGVYGRGFQSFVFWTSGGLGFWGSGFFGV